MATVWVIEQGEYSDYRVVGVFSSRENAQCVFDAIKGEYDKPTIAEWPLDPVVNELMQGFKPYLVHMLKDGTTEIAEEKAIDSSQIRIEFHIWERSQAPAYQGKNVQDVLIATVWARDKDHAIKITNERRTQMIAAGEWGKD